MEVVSIASLDRISLSSHTSNVPLQVSWKTQNCRQREPGSGYSHIACVSKIIAHIKIIKTEHYNLSVKKSLPKRANIIFIYKWNVVEALAAWQQEKSSISVAFESTMKGMNRNACARIAPNAPYSSSCVMRSTDWRLTTINCIFIKQLTVIKTKSERKSRKKHENK